MCPNQPLLLVLVRDPARVEKDDCFFTTDLDRASVAVVTEYGDRWPVEVTIRNSKQLLGLEEPQCWQDDGPERAAGLGLWLVSLVWLCYLCAYPRPVLPTTPWYPQKRTPSFADALTALRLALWERNMTGSSSAPQPGGIISRLISLLARAA